MSFSLHRHPTLFFVRCTYKRYAHHAASTLRVVGPGRLARFQHHLLRLTPSVTRLLFSVEYRAAMPADAVLIPYAARRAGCAIAAHDIVPNSSAHARLFYAVSLLTRACFWPSTVDSLPCRHRWTGELRHPAALAHGATPPHRIS